MYKREVVKEEVEREVVVDIICDICGDSCTEEIMGQQFTNYATLYADWGYGSPYDTQEHTCHICPTCYDSLPFLDCVRVDDGPSIGERRLARMARHGQGQSERRRDEGGGTK